MLPSPRPLTIYAALLCAATAWAQGKSRLVVLELSPLDPEVSEAVARQVHGALNHQLSSAFTIVPNAEIDELRAGLVRPPDVSAVLNDLNTAKDRLGAGDAKGALKLLKKVHAALEPLKPDLRDYTPITSALLYTAVAEMHLKRKKPAQAAFTEL